MQTWVRTVPREEALARLVGRTTWSEKLFDRYAKVCSEDPLRWYELLTCVISQPPGFWKKPERLEYVTRALCSDERVIAELLADDGAWNVLANPENPVGAVLPMNIYWISKARKAMNRKDYFIAWSTILKAAEGHLRKPSDHHAFSAEPRTIEALIIELSEAMRDDDLIGSTRESWCCKQTEHILAPLARLTKRKAAREELPLIARPFCVNCLLGKKKAKPRILLAAG